MMKKTRNKVSKYNVDEVIDKGYWKETKSRNGVPSSISHSGRKSRKRSKSPKKKSPIRGNRKGSPKRGRSGKPSG